VISSIFFYNSADVQRLKRVGQNDAVELTNQSSLLSYTASIVGASGSAKAVASLITYPHEVIRTRLRQPTINGIQKYTGLMQTLKLVVAEEGVKALYGGLTPHMLRVVPNAACMFLIYEVVASKLAWIDRWWLLIDTYTQLCSLYIYTSISPHCMYEYLNTQIIAIAFADDNIDIDVELILSNLALSSMLPHPLSYPIEVYASERWTIRTA
jgi:hypothetical protein